MKVLISTGRGGLDDQVHPLFGRAPTFTLVELVPDAPMPAEARTLKNPAMDSGSGAGMAAAQAASDLGADAVISGSFGPKASHALTSLGISMHLFSGPVKEALELLLSGKLPPAGPSGPGAGQGLSMQMGRGFRGGGRV